MVPFDKCIISDRYFKTKPPTLDMEIYPKTSPHKFVMIVIIGLVEKIFPGKTIQTNLPPGAFLSYD